MWAASSRSMTRALTSASSSSHILFSTPVLQHPTIRAFSTNRSERANASPHKGNARYGYDKQDRVISSSARARSPPRQPYGRSRLQGKPTGHRSNKGKQEATTSNSVIQQEESSELNEITANTIEEEAQEIQEAEQAAEAESPAEDSLALVQQQLRAYFSAKSPRASSSSHTNVKLDTAEEELVGTVDAIEVIPPASMLDDTMHVDPKSSAEQLGGETAAPQSYPRPTLSELQRSDPDHFAGLYQSDTAWDPRQEYALMQDGPKRRSFLRDALAQGRRQYIVVILDADNLVFHPRHLNQGYDGGKFVYDELRSRIAQKHRLIPHQLDLRIRAFCNLHPLTTVLHEARAVRRGDFIDFWQGLTDSSLLNYVVNVGRGSQAADWRVKAALADAIQDPHCFRAYLGGLDDFGYKEELNAIHEMGLLDTKVNLIQVPGFAVESNVYKEYAHRAIDLDYLFANGGANALRNTQRHNQAAADAIDADIQDTASKPCVFHHLAAKGCDEGERCRYSHEPISIGHKERLRALLKRRKCPSVARGEECAFGDDCLFSH